MAGHRELSKDVDIDIAGLFYDIWKKKSLILVVSLVVGAAIFFIMNSISPRYQTKAQLIIEPRESQFTRVDKQNFAINSNEFDKAAVLSQVQIILSDSIAISTIKKLDLADKDEFKNADKPSIISDLLVLAHLKNKKLNIPPEERVLKAFKKRLKAYSVEDSRVIEIVFWANDPNLTKKVTNTIADEYLQLQRDSKLETDSSATKFLEPEIENLRKKVRTAEAKVATFRSNSDILQGTNNALLATQQLSEVSTELSRVRAQRSNAQAKISSIRSTIDTGASLDAIPEVVASPLIQRLRELQVQLRAQISQLSTTLLPAHPRLKALKSQLSDFEKQILREARSILRSLENNIVIASNQENSLSQELSRLKAESARIGEAEVELRALEREALSQRELLQAYMSKFREATGRQSNKYSPINARIISGAHLPTDSFYPKTVPYSIAATIVTAILTIIGILTASLINGKAYRAIHQSELAPNDQVSNDGKSAGDADRQDADNQVAAALDQIRLQPAFHQSKNQQNSNERDDGATDKHGRRRHSRRMSDDVNYNGELEPAYSNVDTSSPDKNHDQTDQARESSNDLDKSQAIEHRGQRQASVIAPSMDIGDKLATDSTNRRFLNVIGTPDLPDESADSNHVSISMTAEGLLGMGDARIAIVSPGGDEGSITTWLLARRLAMAGKSIVVMDMTGSGVTSMQMLGSTTMPGVRDLLSGNGELREIIAKDRYSPVKVLAVGTSVPQDGNAAQERLSALIDELANQNDYVLIDCGYADMSGLARVADAETVILVSALGSPDASTLENELIDIGYIETISVNPSNQEMQDLFDMVAA